MPRILPLLLLSLALGAMPHVLGAQARTDLDGRRAEVTRLLDQAERGPTAAFEQGLRALGDHPLRPWIEYARLRRELGSTPDATVEAFLARHRDTVPAQLLRDAWLRRLAARGAWGPFLQHFGGDGDATLRCAQLRALQATGARVDEAWLDEAQALWLSPRSMPDLCNPVFATLQMHGRLDTDLRWQRWMLAAEAGEDDLARFLARGLPGDDARRAEDYLAFLAAPHARAATWPADDRSRAIVVLGLARLARTDPDAAETRLEALAPALSIDEATAGPVRAQIALWTVASYRPEAAERLARVPADAYDERLHEWRVRDALARRDDAGALDAIARMPAAQRESPRWRYFQARLTERRGDAATAADLYAQAAATATFHGFLAADRIGAPYALCPLEVEDDRELRREVAEDPALVRALELFRIDRPGWAAREWRDALDRMQPRQRREAVRLARAAGWHDRMFSLAGDDPDELRYYRLRFPLRHPTTVRSQAEQLRLDPALIAAVTRAESAWMPRARSPADARGLMQVLPSTGAAVARRHGIAWHGADTLYRPITNLRLGTAYMREMLDHHGGHAYRALAAYNAGPAPVARWRSQRPDFDPDFWIETIPYRETREYVARVLAFSVIYDWRLGHPAVPVSERMLGREPQASERREFACAVRSEPGVS